MTRKPKPKNEKLLLALAQNCMSNRIAARAAGVSEFTISGLVNRRRDPKPETVRALCRILKRTPAELDLAEVSR